MYSRGLCATSLSGRRHLLSAVSARVGVLPRLEASACTEEGPDPYTDVFAPLCTEHQVKGSETHVRTVSIEPVRNLRCGGSGPRSFIRANPGTGITPRQWPELHSLL